MNHDIKKSFGLFLIFLLVAFEAGAYVDPPTFVPAAPTSSDVVVMTFRAGYCDAFAGEEYRLAEVAVNNGFIDVILDGESVTGVHCIYPPVVEYPYTIGRFAPGDYNVRLFRRAFSPPFPVGEFPYFVAPLTVSKARAVSIAATDGRADLLLVSAIAAVAFLALRANRCSQLLVLFFLGAAWTDQCDALSSDTKRISILLSGANAAPSPEDIVSHDYSGGGAPPPSGLAIENPSGAAFLMLPRAEGEFASYLREKPDLPRAKLERYVVVAYPSQSDIDSALAALQSDPFVVYAHISTLEHHAELQAAVADDRFFFAGKSSGRPELAGSSIFAGCLGAGRRMEPCRRPRPGNPGFPPGIRSFRQRGQSNRRQCP